MKNFAAKFKGLNYKQLVIEHGEKFVLGMIGLFVLVCLAGTSWSRYDKQPEEFIKKAEQGEANLRNSNWTAEKRKEFESGRDIMQSVQLLQSPIESGRFEYSTSWFWPMYPAVLKISEPKWLAPIEPIATGSRFVMVELPPAAVQNNEMIAGIPEGSPAARRSEPPEDDEFAIRRPNTVGSGVPGAPATADAATVAPATNPLVANLTGPSSGSSGMMMPGMDSGMPAVHARGVRFIAVRAAVPLGEQLDEIVKAMHETKQSALKHVEYLDFEIQRQTAKPGQQPWSDKDEDWDKVDLQATLEMLDRIDFDTELVDLAYTDPVFTMPLPRRILGGWTKYASHPLIKAMTQEQAEAQRLLTEKMLEEAEKQRALLAGTTKKGFAPKVVDGRGLRSQFSSQMGTMINDMRAEMESNPKGVSSYFANMPGVMDSYQAQVNQAGDGRMSKYLLFRYFDFQVTPGNAYRYRIRMTLRNPNFRRPVEELVDESIAVGELRHTPWSEPTPHVYVPEDQKIFLTKTDKARTDTGLPSAFMDVYQWFSEAGTTIAAKIERLQLGQFVGGWCADTEVYRPATDRLVNESVPVYTGSLLTDLAPAATSTATPTDFDFSEHADLKLDLKKLRQLDVVDKALLVDRFGELTTLNPKVSIDERSLAAAQVDRERAGVRARMKERPQLTGPMGGDLGAMVGYGSGEDEMSSMMNMMGGSGMGMMPGMGGGNALRKGAKRPTGSKPPRGPRGAGAGSSSSGP